LTGYLTAAEKRVFGRVGIEVSGRDKTRRATRLLRISVVFKIVTTTSYCLPSLLNST